METKVDCYFASVSVFFPRGDAIADQRMHRVSAAAGDQSAPNPLVP